ALRQWGQKYGSEFVSEDPVLVDEIDRLPIGPVSMLSHDGRILDHTGLNLVKREDVGKRVDGTVARAGEPLGMGDVIDMSQVRQAASN
ncbi:MAG: transcriptional regulator, partial [Pseudomonadota bacterium]